MNWTAEPSVDAGVILGRARAERARAARAAAKADDYERKLATATTDSRRALCTCMAAIHRSIAERHRTSAQLHEGYAGA